MGFLKVQKYLRSKKAKLYTYLIKGDFGFIGNKSIILPPFHTNDPSEIYIGSGCCVNPGGWLDCVRKYHGKEFAGARIDIGDNTYIGNRAHIIACSSMKKNQSRKILSGKS